MGDLYSLPVSNREGRFVASETVINTMIENGQVAFQYADAQGNPSMDIAYNPFGSFYAIEGIISSDGRILGRMGHPERSGKYVAKNIPYNKNQPLFRAGVRYYK